jgi:hypothetical protein
VGLSAGCNNYKYTAVTEDTSKVVSGTNGGFSVETGDYVYFINGKTDYTEDNTFGTVVKGSIQRISKTNLSARNYTDTETIVPLIAYSGNYDSGIYIYGDTIYYSTPSIDKNSDGEIQSQKLEFKSSKLNGSETMGSYYYQASSNSIEYRYVQVDNTVYLMYVLSESLYGTSTTNIHSVNTETGTNTLLAYNVDSYVFDSEDLENPYIYYTMAVTNNLGTDYTISEEYNQVYRVRADVTESPREYDFSDIEEDDDDEDTLYYLNYGEFILDGIGIIAGNNQDRITQYNYNYTNIINNADYKAELDHSDYTYELEYYKNGRLIVSRSETVGGSDSTSLYSIKDNQITSSWDAIKANNTANENSIDLFLSSSSDIEYNFVTFDNGVEKVVYEGSDGIYIDEISNGKLSNDENVGYIITEASSPEIIALRQETTSDGETHWYVYYNGTPTNGTAGYYRIAIDGARTQYERNKYPIEENLAYTDVALLDMAVVSSWYSPEFVDGQLLFASSTEGYSSYNYIMALDLRNADGKLMTNKELKGYNEQYNAVLDKITAYNSVENSDGTSAYENLSNALSYLFYAGVSEADYLDELVQAYVEIEGQDEEYIYSADSKKIYGEYFATASDEWTFEKFKSEMSLSDKYTYTTAPKTINNVSVNYNVQSYYYSVVGQVDEDDADAIIETLRSGNSISDYPEEDETWWESLSTVAKVFFVIGMVVAGLVIIAAAIVLYIVIKKHKAKKAQAVVEDKMAVDITDEKDIDVYSEETNEDHTAEIENGESNVDDENKG